MRERKKERKRSACIAAYSLATYLHHLDRLSALFKPSLFSLSYGDHELIRSTDMPHATECVKSSPKAAGLTSRRLPHRGLENLHDVFNTILGTLLSNPTKNAIKNLSCVSRGLRNLCLPVLFHDCVITTNTTHNRYLPPAYARPYIRYVLRFTSNPFPAH